MKSQLPPTNKEAAYEGDSRCGECGSYMGGHRCRHAGPGFAPYNGGPETKPWYAACHRFTKRR